MRGGGRLAAAGDPELAEDAGDVHADRLGADERLVGDLAVGPSGGDQPEHLDDYTDERVADMVRAAAGLPDVAVTVRPQIQGRTSRCSASRSARTWPAPIGSAGCSSPGTPRTSGRRPAGSANAGIQDAHNLAWKLALVLDGTAGAGLLDTYEAERRPVRLLTMEQALARFGTRMGPGEGPRLIDYGGVDGLPRRGAGAPGRRCRPFR